MGSGHGQALGPAGSLQLSKSLALQGRLEEPADRRLIFDYQNAPISPGHGFSFRRKLPLENLPRKLLIFLELQRQGEPHGGPTPLLVHRPDPSAVGLHDGPADGQTQTVPSALLTLGPPVIHLKDFF